MAAARTRRSEILARYRAPLTHVESANDGGQADAVARGFAHTSGEIMAYLNSDDVLAPGRARIRGAVFRGPSRAWTRYTAIACSSTRTTSWTSYWILPPHRDWMMKRWDYIPQETCFWRRRIYDAGRRHRPVAFNSRSTTICSCASWKRGRMERVDRFLGAFRGIRHRKPRRSPRAWCIPKSRASAGTTASGSPAGTVWSNWRFRNG